ncbi:MAG: hypothetical protein D6794_00845 [Deltaproteobacteria bacterium]|nr:MAG: hypothetical protein D6794_00845 [Deltaproteobacteria bacterium]
MMPYLFLLVALLLPRVGYADILLGDPGNHATIAMNNQNQSLVTWHLSWPSGVLAKSYDSSGNLIHDFGMIANSGKYPDVDSDGQNFVLTWAKYPGDMNLNETFVLVAKCDALGNVILPVMRANDDVYSAIQDDKVRPDIAMNLSGEFIVSWNQGLNIYARAFDAAGTPLTPSIRLNNLSQLPRMNQIGVPDIDMNDAGDVIVAWGNTDYYGNPAVTYRTFNIHDVNWIVGDEIVAIPPGPGTEQIRPAVAINNAGDMAITWSEKTNGIRTVPLFQYEAAAARWHRISVGDGFQPYYSVVSIDALGGFCIAANARNDIHLNCYDSMRNKKMHIIVNDIQSGTQVRPAIGFSDNGLMGITWESTHLHPPKNAVMGKFIPYP